jgi:hypothetical protein
MVDRRVLFGTVSFLDTVEERCAGLPILHLTGPVFQQRNPFAGGGFDVERFIAAVRHCLPTGGATRPRPSGAT